MSKGGSSLDHHHAVPPADPVVPRLTNPQFCCARRGRTSDFWDRLAPAAVNNYYIRSLLGTQFFDWPVASVNITHTQQAMLEVRRA